MVTIVFYYAPINFQGIDKTFLTISTFLFAIFSGFFIARQGGRYSEIRRSIATLDGSFSSIYRSCGHLGGDVQVNAGAIILNYYKMILENKAWDYNFLHKTTTLTDLHRLMDAAAGKDGFTGMANVAVSGIMLRLGNIQVERKNLVALREERIPSNQWIPIYFLAGILLLVLSISMSSEYLWAESFIKAVFATGVIIVMILLRQLDSLVLFEGLIGEHSAMDMVEIIEGKK